MDILRPNSLLNKVLPQPIAKVYKAKADIFPVWVAESAEVFIANIGNTNLRLALIYPKRQLEFNRLAGLQRLVNAKLSVPTVLVADEINPKYRSLFVKNKVPYIYKDETIFAPELGVVLNSQRTAPLVFKNANVNIAESEIGPFELKLIAAYLTDLLDLDNFNLQELSLRLKKAKYDCSMGKLSGSILRLIKEGFLEVRGTGPHRIVNFVPKAEAWKRLMSVSLKKTHQFVPGEYVLERMSLPFSGESALSKFSQLAEPRTPIYAVTNKQFFKIRGTGKPIGDFGEPKLFYDIRKEDPALFAIKDAVNPIEIYMDLKNDPDERIQIALEEMLEAYGLKEIANVKS